MNQLISVETALDLIARHTPTRSIETINLAQAEGRTLAVPLVARISRPPASVSAMDGYALSLSDVATPGAALKLIGEAPAGTPTLKAAKPCASSQAANSHRVQTISSRKKSPAKTAAMSPSKRPTPRTNMSAKPGWTFKTAHSF